MSPSAEPLGRSWVLALRVLPVDYDDLCLVELEPGQRFLERSSMLSMSMWQHERTVTPAPEGCEVTDRLAFQLRASVGRDSRAPPALASAIVARLFAPPSSPAGEYWAGAGATRP